MQIPSVQITHSSVAGSVPDAADLEIGALAVNVEDAALYTKDYTGTVKRIKADIAAITHAATSKTTPVDADELPLVDSAASNVLKKLTWANLKAALATWINGNLIPASFTTLKASGTTNLNSDLQVKGTSTAANAQLYVTATDTVSSIHASSSSGVAKTLKLHGSGSSSSSLDLTGSKVKMNVATELLGGATLLSTTGALTGTSGGNMGTLANSPSSGDPTKWIAINDAGTTRYIPTWL